VFSTLPIDPTLNCVQHPPYWPYTELCSAPSLLTVHWTVFGTLPIDPTLNCVQHPPYWPYSMEIIRFNSSGWHDPILITYMSRQGNILFFFLGTPYSIRPRIVQYLSSLCPTPTQYQIHWFNTMQKLYILSYFSLSLSQSFKQPDRQEESGTKKKTNLKKYLIRILWKVRHKRQWKSPHSSSHIVRKPQIISLYFIAILLCLYWESKRHSHMNRFISTMIKARKQDPP